MCVVYSFIVIEKFLSKGWFTLDRDVLWVVAIDHVQWFTYDRTHRIRSQCIISDRNASRLIVGIDRPRSSFAQS